MVRVLAQTARGEGLIPPDLHSFHCHRLFRRSYYLLNDTILIKEYLNIHWTGKLTRNIIDPVHLRRELIKINKLPQQLTLPENPWINIWHYYKFLTVTPMNHENKLGLMIKIPLIDLDSSVTLYKVYNLPIYHKDTGKSLIYQKEGNNLAMTKDNNYSTILSDSDFTKCTLAQGHFCSLTTALYHLDSSLMHLIALFLKSNNKINKYCKLAVCDIKGPQANYLDQGIWAISVITETQMEIKCQDHTHVKTIKPPMTLINLQPACSAFFLQIKLPPYLNNTLNIFIWHSKLQIFIFQTYLQMTLESGKHLISQTIKLMKLKI